MKNLILVVGLVLSVQVALADAWQCTGTLFNADGSDRASDRSATLLASGTVGTWHLIVRENSTKKLVLTVDAQNVHLGLYDKVAKTVVNGRSSEVLYGAATADAQANRISFTQGNDKVWAYGLCVKRK